MEYADLPLVLPVVPLSEVVVFPATVLPAVLTSPRALAALELAAESKEKKAFFAFAPAGPDGSGADERGFRVRGTVGDILEFARIHDSAARVLIEGMWEADLVEVEHREDHSRGVVQRLELPWRRTKEVAAAQRAVVAQFRTYCGLMESIPDEIAEAVAQLENPAHVVWHVATHLKVPAEVKHGVLEEKSILERLRLLLQALRSENDLRELENRLLEEAKTQIGRGQREYFLNEQLKAIERELGVADEDSEVEELTEKIAKLPLSAEAREKAERELRRLGRMPSISPEATVARTYLETILELPWGVVTEDDTDLERAARILDEDHHGLEKVKERMLEFLAVVRQVGTIRGPILCLVGPPGVGKTSLAQSVARALGRKFVRVALGGVRDEAEVRGHRRTYIGSLPGRIIQSLRKAGSMNPVFLLDEVDKLSSDYRGDPASALLEVLDPEQNRTFQDHYLELDFDLSRVLFITTANYQGAIPPPLLDRMELIRLQGYTEDEKVAIARQFLLPRRAEEHGLERASLEIGEPALRFLIQAYTREAGVRSLDRRLAEVCRKVVRERQSGGGSAATGTTADTTVGAADAAPAPARRRPRKPRRETLSRPRLRALLGPPRYKDAVQRRTPEVGVITGLAWTEVGGELLPVETLAMAGQGKLTLTLTGKLGDVMQESARAALAYIRRHWKALGVPERFYLDTDLHVHVPEGAIPKDGPSAGLALLLSMVSALSGRPAAQDVAMTGEITLRGRVLRIGGLKEKALAARRHGLRTVLMPEENRDDLEELPAAVRAEMEFVAVRHVDEAVARVLGAAPRSKSATRDARPRAKSAPRPRGDTAGSTPQPRGIRKPPARPTVSARRRGSAGEPRPRT